MDFQSISTGSISKGGLSKETQMSDLPAPPTDVEIVQHDGTVDVSWQGWSLVAGPSKGGGAHKLQLYLSAIGNAKVQVTINGWAMTQFGQAVTADYTKQNEQCFTYYGKWKWPPSIIVRMPPAAGAELHLSAAMYDGVVIPNIGHHFITQGQYRFNAS